MIEYQNRTTQLPLILASQSPRRRQLLERAGYQFTINAPPESVECGICSDRGPRGWVAESSFLKARYVAGKTENGLVVAADTVACCQGRILGKPSSREHAKEMLEFMSGREHEVLTGVTLWVRPDDRYETHVECTLLEMQALDPKMLEDYLETDAWIGKAGAFGYQDGIDWVRIKSGSANNVVGLSVEKLPEWIAKLEGESIQRKS